MKVVGLTGGIGSGKSTVAQIFKTLGVAVYNSDQRAKELYFLPEVKKKVEDLLGKEVYKNPSSLDKKLIRSKIFSDKSLLHKLNGIIHPAVAKDFEDFKTLHKKDVYVIKESALLIEAGLHKKTDKLLVVTSLNELRTARIKKRDKLSTKEIEAVINEQIPDNEKIKSADWVIENNEEKLLIPQVLKIHRLF